MKLFKYLRDVVSGRIKYLNETNIPVVNELWNGLENLENPNALILKHFLVAAKLVVESLMTLYQENTEEIFSVNAKKLNIEQVRQLYCILLSYFTFLFYTSNPYLRKEQKQALFQVKEEVELAKELLQSLDKIGKTDMFAIGKEVWDKVVDVIGFGDKENFFQIYYFIKISAKPYETAVDNIKLEINF
ncbi:hypothetical protein ES703_118042 [subsurface metagenome]